tara:strand:- start:91 stop:381 length:291 start_codon:yes stop_codon:yes gene_type:complete
MRSFFGYGALTFGILGILSGLSDIFFGFFISPMLDYESNVHYLSYLFYLGIILFFGLGIIFCAITVMLNPAPQREPEISPPPLPRKPDTSQDSTFL